MRFGQETLTASLSYARAKYALEAEKGSSDASQSSYNDTGIVVDDNNNGDDNDIEDADDDDDDDDDVEIVVQRGALNSKTSVRSNSSYNIQPNHNQQQRRGSTRRTSNNCNNNNNNCNDNTCLYMSSVYSFGAKTEIHFSTKV